MPDRRIEDFATLPEANREDLLLVCSESETYNVKFGTIMDAVQEDSAGALAAAKAAQKSAENAESKAYLAEHSAGRAWESATQAEERAKAAQMAAESAQQSATDSAASAQSAEEKANTAELSTEEAKSAAEVAKSEAASAKEASDKAESEATAAKEAAQKSASESTFAKEAAESAESNAVAARKEAEMCEEAAASAKEIASNAESFADRAQKSALSAEEAAQAAKTNSDSAVSTATALETFVNETISDLNLKVKNGEFDGKDGVDGKDGADYILTESDKQEIADIAVKNATEAANNANSAAETAQSIVDLINEKLANGEFNGTDYILTAADKKEIADLVSPLAESMQGGTVTYEIPKECYGGEFWAFDRNNIDDPNANRIYIPCVLLRLAEIVIDVKRFEEDLEAGLIDESAYEGIDELPLDEQVSLYEEAYKDYITTIKYPWCPDTIKSPFYYYMTLGNAYKYAVLNQVFRNDIRFQMIIKRADYDDDRCVIVSSAEGFGTESLLGVTHFYPVIMGQEIENDDGTGTYRIFMQMMGTCPKYGQDNKYVTKDDTIEEVTVRFIPNNTYVEVDKNEEAV